jgi:hypothetical protein
MYEYSSRLAIQKPPFFAICLSLYISRAFEWHLRYAHEKKQALMAHLASLNYQRAQAAKFHVNHFIGSRFRVRALIVERRVASQEDETYQCDLPEVRTVKRAQALLA